MVIQKKTAWSPFQALPARTAGRDEESITAESNRLKMMLISLSEFPE